MTSNPIFRGVATALITPLTASGVDYPALGRLIDWQISEGVNALVIAGTTGEGSTLTDEEHRKLLRYSVEHAAGRIPIIAGTGSNDTAYAISLTKYACEVGCDAMLVVTPYYNKATQNGLVQMYTAIANASTKPLILYNVPSRTGVNIQPATYQKLAQHPMIAGIKEANGDISSIVTTASLAGDSLSIYSGNDDQIVPILSMGGSGVISVLSNVLPRKTVEICTRFWSGDIIGSAALQCELLPLIHALFSEVNPIPVKAALEIMGKSKMEFRLPLCEPEDATVELLRKELKAYGIIK